MFLKDESTFWLQISILWGISTLSSSFKILYVFWLNLFLKDKCTIIYFPRKICLSMWTFCPPKSHKTLKCSLTKLLGILNGKQKCIEICNFTDAYLGSSYEMKRLLSIMLISNKDFPFFISQQNSSMIVPDFEMVFTIF